MLSVGATGSFRRAICAEHAGKGVTSLLSSRIQRADSIATAAIGFSSGESQCVCDQKPSGLAIRRIRPKIVYFILDGDKRGLSTLTHSDILVNSDHLS